MRLQDELPQPHCGGYIFIGASNGDEPQFSLTLRHHATRLLEQGEAPPHYLLHPLAKRLKEGGDNIREVPVRLLYDTPQNNVMARYEAWASDYIHGPVCISNGEQGKRLDRSRGAWEPTICRGPGMCPCANERGVTCVPVVRMPVMLDLNGESALFELHSNSLNTYRSILGALSLLHAQYGHLRGLPLQLVPWFKSGRASDYQAYACITIELRPGSNHVPPTQILPELESYGAAARASWYSQCIATPAELESVEMNNADATPKVHIQARAAADAQSLFSQITQYHAGTNADVQ